MQQFKNIFINEYIRTHNITVLGSDEDKPWGGYYILDKGENYDNKILWLKPGESLSLQYHGTPTHKGHAEKWHALSDMKIVIGNKSVVGLSGNEFNNELKNLRVIFLYEDDIINIPAGYLHAAVNNFNEDVYWLETRTSEMPETSDEREANITRVYDKSLRDNSKPWPQELVERIKNQL